MKTIYNSILFIIIGILTPILTQAQELDPALKDLINKLTLIFECKIIV